MEKKVSRRVALGAAIGGLAATPVLLRYFRGGQKLEEADPYGEIAILPGQITSDLSPEELEKAVESLERERKMWLRFRGVAGNLDVINKTKAPGSQETQVLKDKGYVSLSLDLRTKAAQAMLPVSVDMVYSGTQDSDPIWRFKTADSNARDSDEFVGTDIESVHHAILYSHLTAPLVPMLSLSNMRLEDILEFWEVSREDTSSLGHREYVFESNGKPIGGRMLPTLTFADGHFVEMIPARSAGRPYPSFSFRDHVEQNGVSYPTAITMSFGDHGEFEQEHDSIETILSDVEVASV